MNMDQEHYDDFQDCVDAVDVDQLEDPDSDDETSVYDYGLDMYLEVGKLLEYLSVLYLRPFRSGYIPQDIDVKAVVKRSHYARDLRLQRASIVFSRQQGWYMTPSVSSVPQNSSQSSPGAAGADGNAGDSMDVDVNPAGPEQGDTGPPPSGANGTGDHQDRFGEGGAGGGHTRYEFFG